MKISVVKTNLKTIFLLIYIFFISIISIESQGQWYKVTSNKSFNDFEMQLKKKPDPKENVSTLLKDLENFDQEFITISEINLLTQQLYSCLNLNAGVANLKELKPIIYIEVNPDRTVKNSKIVNSEKLVDPSFRTAAEAAMRAVNNPDCSPLLLPEDKYDLWKEINITFDFSWMLD